MSIINTESTLSDISTSSPNTSTNDANNTKITVAKEQENNTRENNLASIVTANTTNDDNNQSFFDRPSQSKHLSRGMWSLKEDYFLMKTLLDYSNLLNKFKSARYKGKFWRHISYKLACHYNVFRNKRQCRDRFNLIFSKYIKCYSHNGFNNNVTKNNNGSDNGGNDATISKGGVELQELFEECHKIFCLDEYNNLSLKMYRDDGNEGLSPDLELKKKTKKESKNKLKTAKTRSKKITKKEFRYKNMFKVGDESIPISTCSSLSSALSDSSDSNATHEESDTYTDYFENKNVFGIDAKTDANCQETNNIFKEKYAAKGEYPVMKLCKNIADLDDSNDEKYCRDYNKNDTLGGDTLSGDASVHDKNADSIVLFNNEDLNLSNPGNCYHNTENNNNEDSRTNNNNETSRTDTLRSFSIDTTRNNTLRSFSNGSISCSTTTTTPITSFNSFNSTFAKNKTKLNYSQQSDFHNYHNNSYDINANNMTLEYPSFLFSSNDNNKSHKTTAITNDDNLPLHSYVERLKSQINNLTREVDSLTNKVDILMNKNGSINTNNFQLLPSDFAISSYPYTYTYQSQLSMFGDIMFQSNNRTK
ncbi:uncharacterized protein SCDLUD_000681 [Saccharomycodes ludwigii]|uniref:uncharacterized protein n=1 Tax=Saccharomycodes ludwigii TaxID=36035 RepID=UPI001E838A6D|nr:hypothetical protein SCDLUD_000681 [Saccharomycodes ludwigii]KAH3903070.1 hypothetical protein SCDLUD_000681 [Saccharomycodes ludwigii]